MRLIRPKPLSASSGTGLPTNTPSTTLSTTLANSTPTTPGKTPTNTREGFHDKKHFMMVPKTAEVDEKTSTMTVTTVAPLPKKKATKAFFKKSKSVKRRDRHTTRAEFK
ncbi:hypothetical protein EJ06DRAFT_561540 [Trichodelitschia bisporula]|uniref:Uncharacterized protein n=1 Tax=Trichodelitschia bisporula TaxID=703511 RepID=A0A6G1IAV8_9PEZI|nr:hypothetical protein EJ06DRAFT_561540 [Trichodelitschia bisporula]